MGKSRKIVRSVVGHLPTRVQVAVRSVAHRAFPAIDARYSFSQEGEDLLIGRMFDGQDSGFYVDVGAHHPTRFSNTYLLYRRGWRGINIDPTPGSMTAFGRARPRDTNLEMAISLTPGVVTLSLFDEPALNTVSEDRRLDVSEATSYAATGEVEVRADTLASVLSEHLPSATQIDLMTIDVEGSDFDVLRSNDWERFRPRVLVIEVLNRRLDELGTQPGIRYLSERGYGIYAKLVHSVFLVDSRCWIDRQA